jgi:hypothetical protein
MQGTSSSGGCCADTTSAVNRPISDIAEEKLRELVEKGDLQAIELAIKMRPQRIEVTC